jgi:hypothetical protein
LKFIPPLELRCCICQSADWIAVAPGTSANASRFTSDRVADISPGVPVETKAYCLDHWRQSWVPAPPKPIEDEDQAIGQENLFVQQRIASARAALAGEIAAARAEAPTAPLYRGGVE